ncbi:hypothetical protein [Sulfurimonas sp.]|uniref:hypothetical protein n=1 Tax=Sulfurimonas sp. TaxID=2022749 RepID=UPI0025F3AB76|nr:hypothetical protein [Sulfurimonas sp.]MCK9454718.1 hypothetical protein [Sulfurimonas sp.]
MFADAGMEVHLEELATNPKSFDDPGVLIGLVFGLFIGLLFVIDYIKNKFKS